MDEHYEQSFRTRAKNGLVEKQIFVKEPTCNFNLQMYNHERRKRRTCISLVNGIAQSQQCSNN